MSSGPAHVPGGPDAAADTLVISAVGDLMLGGRLTPVLIQRGPHYPWPPLRALLDSAGFLMGNLEAAFLSDTTGVARAQKTYTFAVPPALVDVLSSAGFDAVTLANNHVLDFGLPALLQTWSVLEAAGIAHAGTGMDRAAAHRHRIAQHDGRRIALLAYNHVFPEEFWATRDRPGTAHASDTGLAREVAAARREADVVVVSFHWGAERMETPKDYQRILARIAVDNGADLVIGHHPHVLQPLEWYRGSLIAYSLGNFLFGSYTTTPTGALLQVVFGEEGIREAHLHPLDVNNFRVRFRPTPVPASGWDRLGSAVVRALADSAVAGSPGVVVDPEGRIRLLPPS